jgi:hypothetical protein
MQQDQFDIGVIRFLQYVVHLYWVGILILFLFFSFKILNQEWIIDMDSSIDNIGIWANCNVMRKLEPLSNGAALSVTYATWSHRRPAGEPKISIIHSLIPRQQRHWSYHFGKRLSFILLLNLCNSDKNWWILSPLFGCERVKMNKVSSNIFP